MHDKNNNSENKPKRNKISGSKVHQMRANSEANKKTTYPKTIPNVSRQANQQRKTTNQNAGFKNATNSTIRNRNISSPKTNRPIRRTNDQLFDFEQEISKPVSNVHNKTSKNKTILSKPSNTSKQQLSKTSTPKNIKNTQSKTRANPIKTPAENITYLNDKFNPKTQTKTNRSKNTTTSTKKPQNKGSKKINNLQNKLNSKPNTFIEKYYKGIAVVLLFTIFVGIGVKGYKKLFASSTNKTQTVATQTEQQTKTTNKVPDCDIGDLNLNVFLTENQVYVGQGANFGISVTNRSNKTCLARAGSDKFGVRVMSGDQKIWDSVTCPTTSEDNPLLLRSGETWTGNISWDGLTYGAKCEKLVVSGAGTYRLLGVKNGDLLDVSHPFVLFN